MSKAKKNIKVRDLQPKKDAKGGGGTHAPLGGTHAPTGGTHAPTGGVHAPTGGGQAPTASTLGN